MAGISREEKLFRVIFPLICSFPVCEARLFPPQTSQLQSASSSTSSSQRLFQLRLPLFSRIDLPCRPESRPGRCTWQYPAHLSTHHWQRLSSRVKNSLHSIL